MSLVNDMLNDLEQRRRNHNIDDSGAGELTYGGRSAPWQSMVNPLFILILVVICVSVGYFFSQIFAAFEKQSPLANNGNTQLAAAVLANSLGPNLIETGGIPVESTVIDPEVKTKEELRVQTPSAWNQDKVEASNSHGLVQDSVSALKAEKTSVYGATQTFESPPATTDENPLLENLLIEANGFVIKKQYTTPPLNNAFDRYERVLALDPENLRAKAGVLELVERYLVLAKERMLAKQEMFANETRLDGEQNQSLRYLDRAAAIATRYQHNFSELEIHLAAINDLRRQLQVVTPVSEPFLVAEQSSAIETQNSEVKIKSVKQSKPVDPYRQKLTEAKSLIANNEFQHALVLLESGSPELQQLPEYFAILAALNHQLGRHQTSAEYYSRLIGNNPTNFDYWLGLGVSLDALENWPHALAAFESAQKLGSTDLDTMRYVNLRIRTLSAQGFSGQGLSIQDFFMDGVLRQDLFGQR